MTIGLADMDLMTKLRYRWSGLLYESNILCSLLESIILEIVQPFKTH
jgi:hypothetical protein